jgi:hypothetical protein
LSPSGTGSTHGSVSNVTLLAFYRHRGAAASIGARYLADQPARKSIETIANLLCPPQAQRFATLAAAGEKEARKFIASWFADNFANKRIINLSGWQLSLSGSQRHASAHSRRFQRFELHFAGMCLAWTSAPG